MVVVDYSEGKELSATVKNIQVCSYCMYCSAVIYLVIKLLYLIGHEPSRRIYDFSANNDLIRFLKTIQDSGFYSVLLIGPYVCAEWNSEWVHYFTTLLF